MSDYVETVVIPVPTDNLDAYRQIAEEAASIWIDHGARSYFEGVEDHATSEETGGSMRSYPEITGASADHSIVFASMGFTSRAHRDEVTAAVTDDPRYSKLFEDGMPFDPELMVSGRFDAIVSEQN